MKRFRPRWLLLLALTAALASTAPLSAAVPGEVDESIGTHGLVTTNLGGTYDWPYAVAVQRDGKTVVAGVSNAAGTYDFALARYLPDLSLDPGFGRGGTVLTDFGDSWDWAYAVALQPDGKIVVGGVSDVTGSKGFALARYQPDGTPDRTFGDGGRLSQDLRRLTADVIHAVMIEPDGKILAAGVTYEDEVVIRPNGDFMLARYTPDGRPDPGFGLGGTVTTDFGPGTYDEPYAAVRQRDGRILLGGYTFDSGGVVGDGHGNRILYGVDELAMARYTPGGMPDESFGRGGKVVVDAGTMDEEIHGLAVTPDDQILAAGFVNGERRGEMLVARFRPDGTLDPDFGQHGFTVTAPAGSRSERLSGIVLQPDGKIVVGGQVAKGESGDFALLRYSPQGALDSSFGEGGLVTVDFAGREDQVRALFLQPDGKIVGVGPSETDFALVRLHGGG